MDGEVVNVIEGAGVTASAGTAGLDTQLGGQPTTVSGAAMATGGIDAGHFIERDIDKELFRFKSDDTPLMQLMLNAKKVRVFSPEVEHYMIDEPRCSVVSISAVEAGSSKQFALPLTPSDSTLPHAYDTLLAKGVSGYAEDGVTKTHGKELMLFVTGRDEASGQVICRAVNGPKDSPEDETCTTPSIPEGTTFIILSNALYETQMEVDPDTIVPQPTIIFLQKRGMNHVVSDYYEAQRKRIPFDKALIAEQLITNFKVKGNRTLYAGRKGKVKTNVPKVGEQYVYFTEGVRWQVKKELEQPGKWTLERLIALAKLVFTGEDVPKSVLILSGKNFLENIQCIDYSKHPEVRISVKTNDLGWEVTNIHTVFGDLEFKRDPTLDRLGWSNSALAIAQDRLVHYVYSPEHKSKNRIEGQEATRETLLVWDALALKGSCHVWINGELNTTDSEEHPEITHYHFHEGEDAPADPVEGCVYYMLTDCPGISTSAVKGSLWVIKDGKWEEYSGELIAK